MEKIIEQNIKKIKNSLGIKNIKIEDFSMVSENNIETFSFDNNFSATKLNSKVVFLDKNLTALSYFYLACYELHICYNLKKFSSMVKIRQLFDTAKKTNNYDRINSIKTDATEFANISLKNLNYLEFLYNSVLADIDKYGTLQECTIHIDNQNKKILDYSINNISVFKSQKAKSTLFAFALELEHKTSKFNISYKACIVKAVRKILKLKQKEFHELIGYSKNWLNCVERGIIDVSLKTLAKIFKLLNLNIEIGLDLEENYIKNIFKVVEENE